MFKQHDGFYAKRILRTSLLYTKIPERRQLKITQKLKK